ncbi:MAG: serine/threonine protein kinase [Gemmataceae bacterium]|nr:serine/threonine protein kinase [Gemmataceae bacterium]
MIGRTFLQRFCVERLLCKGGIGLIYIARQAGQDREVVVKVLKPEFAAKATIRERFRREIQVLSRLQHPYLAEYYGASLDPGDMFLVMEYVRGTALDFLQQQRRRFSPERVGKILAQLCEVLQMVHERGIVHCDLKPANIMIVHPDTSCESIKLMDFGLAKVPATLSLTALDMINSSELISGSPGYMSPEQIRSEDVDHRSDLYSVGVMMYEMLAGRPPFEQPTMAALLAAHKKEAPPTLAQRGLNVPPFIETVVQKCLAKHREQRPQSASELLQLYERALGKKIVIPYKPVATSHSHLQGGAGQKQTEGSRAPVLEAPRPAPKPAVDPNASVYTLDVRMPESMALLKLRGFVQDLGGQMVEGEAGVIRVRLDPEQTVQPWSRDGGWSLGERKVQAAPSNKLINMELRIDRADPQQPNQLTITLTLRARNLLSMSKRDWKERYDRIHLDLKAYMQAMR